MSNLARIPKRLARAVTCLLLISGLFSVRPALAQGDEAAWLLGQINGLRQSNGLAPLSLNGHLTASATQHSNYLATHPYTHPHNEANGSTPSSRAYAAGYGGSAVGENVVGGEMATVQWAFQWWVNEPVHFKNMLAPWTEVGIGIVSGPYGHWYTTDFGIGTGGAAPAQPQSQPAAVSKSDGGDNGNNSGNTGGDAPAQPTRRPATRVPTLTPSATFTPSVTFTPRPTFTPTATFTPVPPTPTAIVLEVSPAPVGSQPAVVAQVSTAIPPNATATLAASASAAMVAVALNATPAPAGSTGDKSLGPTTPGDAIRALIPWAILLQLTLLGGFAVSNVVRRKRR